VSSSVGGVVQHVRSRQDVVQPQLQLVVSLSVRGVVGLQRPYIAGVRVVEFGTYSHYGRSFVESLTDQVHMARSGDGHSPLDISPARFR